MSRKQCVVLVLLIAKKEFRMIKTLTLSVLLLFSFVARAQSPVSKGERLLSIDLTTASDDDFGKAFTLARSVGMHVSSLSVS
jgi:hypothetical protein